MLQIFRMSYLGFAATVTVSWSSAEVRGLESIE